MACSSSSSRLLATAGACTRLLAPTCRRTIAYHAARVPPRSAPPSATSASSSRPVSSSSSPSNVSGGGSSSLPRPASSSRSAPRGARRAHSSSAAAVRVPRLARVHARNARIVAVVAATSAIVLVAAAGGVGRSQGKDEAKATGGGSSSSSGGDTAAGWGWFRSRVDSAAKDVRTASADASTELKKAATQGSTHLTDSARLATGAVVDVSKVAASAVGQVAGAAATATAGVAKQAGDVVAARTPEIVQGVANAGAAVGHTISHAAHEAARAVGVGAQQVSIVYNNGLTSAHVALGSLNSAAGQLGEKSVEEGTRLMLMANSLMAQEMTAAGLNGIATVNVSMVVLSLQTSLLVQPDKSTAIVTKGGAQPPKDLGELSPAAASKRWDDYVPLEQALRAGIRKVIAGVCASARTLGANGYAGNVQSTVNLAALGCGLSLTIAADCRQATAARGIAHDAPILLDSHTAAATNTPRAQ